MRKAALIATNSTMASNIAIGRGGVVAALGEVAVAAKHRTMISNVASTKNASDSTLTSGGAVYADGYATVALSHCMLVSNSARVGGAISARGHSNLTTSDCAMSSNSAYWGGAVNVAGRSMMHASRCLLTWNVAVVIGIFQLTDGTAERGGAFCVCETSIVTTEWSCVARTGGR